MLSYAAGIAAPLERRSGFPTGIEIAFLEVDPFGRSFIPGKAVNENGDGMMMRIMMSGWVAVMAVIGLGSGNAHADFAPLRVGNEWRYRGASEVRRYSDGAVDESYQDSLRLRVTARETSSFMPIPPWPPRSSPYKGRRPAIPSLRMRLRRVMRINSRVGMWTMWGCTGGRSKYQCPSMTATIGSKHGN